MTVFEALGIDHAFNMIPEGALMLGAPDKDSELRFTVADAPVFCKTNEIIFCIQESLKTGRISKKSIPMVVGIIQKDKHVMLRINTTGDIESLEAWGWLQSLYTLSEDLGMISEVLDTLGSENIALFYETDEGALLPVSNTMTAQMEYK